MNTANNKRQLKRKAPPGAWKPGQSGNPAGAPKRGESWAELIREVGDMDGPAVAERAAFLAAQFKKLPVGVTLKRLAVMRIYAALIDEPTPGLLTAFMDRADGAVTQRIEGDGTQTIVKVVYEGSAGSSQGDAPAPASDPRQS